METRNYESGASATPPSAPTTPSNGYPQEGVPGVTPPTVPGAHWYYKIGEALRAIVAGSGQTPSDADLNQLLKGLKRFAGGNVTTLTATATLTLDQAGLIEVDASAGNITLTLPGAADLASLGYVFARIDGSANTVTIAAAAGEVVGGAATLPLHVGGIKSIKSNGVNEYHLMSGDVLPYAMVSNASSQSIPNTADTLKTFDTIDSDLASLWDAANNQFVIPHNALIRVTACNTWGSNTVGARSIRVIRGAVATVGCPSLKIESPSVATTLTMTISSTIMEAVAGDTVRVILYQNSGGALNTTANAPQNWFSVEVVKWL